MVDERTHPVEVDVADEPDDGLKRLMKYVFIAMGIALEFVQGSLGYRSFEVADMLVNATGVLLSWGLASQVRFLR